MNTNPYLSIGGWQMWPPQDIIYFEAKANYSTVHFANGKKQMVATTLKTLEQRFTPYSFYRIHKAYLVNMTYIKHYCEYEHTVQLTDDKHIIISRRRLPDFKSKIYKYLI